MAPKSGGKSPRKPEAADTGSGTVHIAEDNPVLALRKAQGAVETELAKQAEVRLAAQKAHTQSSRALAKAVQKAAGLDISESAMHKLTGTSRTTVRAWRSKISRPSAEDLAAIRGLDRRRERITQELADRANERQAAHERYEQTTEALADIVRRAHELDVAETRIVELTKVPRSTVRTWLGKRGWNSWSRP